MKPRAPNDLDFKGITWNNGTWWFRRRRKGARAVSRSLRTDDPRQAVVREALGRNRRFTPHGLRHTFASIHLSRGTNLLWVQRQGGWTSPAVLLSTYAHFLPSELSGFADTLTAPDGTQAALGRPAGRRAPSRTGSHSTKSSTSMVGPPGLEPGTDGLKEPDEPEE
jgi:hypothetical protein